MKLKSYLPTLAALLVLVTSSASMQAQATQVQTTAVASDDHDPVAALSPLDDFWSDNANSKLWRSLLFSKPAESIKRIDNEIEKNPWNVELYYFKEELLEKHNFEKVKIIEQMNIALTAVDKAIIDHPEAAQLHYLKAGILRIPHQDNDKVIEELSTSMTLATKDSKLYFYSILERGKVYYYDMNRLQQADKDIVVYLDRHPKDFSVEAISVEIRTKLEDWLGVIAAYTRWINADPTHQSALFYGRAAAEEKIGKTKDAKKDRKEGDEWREYEKWALDDGY